MLDILVIIDILYILYIPTGSIYINQDFPFAACFRASAKNA